MLATATAALTSTAFANDSNCYCLPGDSCWPSASSWESLNSTVGGRLVATVPIGSPCHDPNYDAAACAALKSDWTTPLPQYVLPELFLFSDCQLSPAIPIKRGN